MQHHRPRVLVVDEDPEASGELSAALMGHGLGVTAVADPESALQQARAAPPDLVVLGACADAPDPFATCRRIRALPEGAVVPVLIVAVLPHDGAVAEAFAAGADDVLTRPVLPTLLIARARQLLRAGAQRRTPPGIEARIRGAFDQAAIGMALVAADGHVLQANQALGQLLGYAPADLEGLHYTRYIHPDDRLLGNRELLELHQGLREQLHLERRYVRKDGSVVWCLLSMTIVPGASGEPSYMVCQFQDVTAVRAAEARLRQSEARLAEAQRIAHLGSWTWDIPTNVMYWSDELYRIMGLARDAFDGSLDAVLAGVHPDDRQVVTAAFGRLLAERAPVYQECRIVRPDGQVRAVALRGELAQDAEAGAPYAIGTVQDVTERQEREATLQALFDSALDAILIADDEGRYVDANPAACALFGLPRERLIGRTIAEFGVVEQPVSTDEDWSQFLQEGVQTGTFILRRPDTAVRYLEFAARAHFLPGRHLSMLRDVTTRREAERALQASQDYLRALVEHAAEITTVVNADGTVRYATPAQWRLLGYPEDTPLGHILDYAHPDDLPHVQSIFTRLATTLGAVVSVELRVRHQDGSWPIFEMTATNLLDNPAVQGIVVNSRDVTARKRIEAQLTHDAFHDGLTGLPNRALFLDRLSQALERAARPPSHQCAVLFLDLDRFKTVNDSLGHQAGDQLLIAAARRLELCVRPGDTVARFGGDEFAILLQDTAVAHEAIATAERIAAAFTQPMTLEGKTLTTSASIGITVCAPGAQPEEVLRDADIAMYRAKRSGPGNHIIADPSMHAEIVRRLELEAALRRALEREEFVLHYQPKMAMDGRAVQGVEALIRWHHPVWGLVSPGEFIPLAEETGLIVAIGAWALRAACRQVRSWLDAGLPPIGVAVNLSAAQFAQPDIAAMIRSIIDEVGVEPQLIGVELTESVLMADAAAMVEALQGVRAVGVGLLAIDDFGTGYSSLSYLQRFPVTAIKIDGSFVRDVATNPSNAAIARAIIALGHSLRLEVIAEGVETEAQRVFLERAGCDHFQGYLASRPLSGEQLAAFVRAMPDSPEG